MSDLASFLLARIAEDEATGQQAVADLDDEPHAGVIGGWANVLPSHLRFAQRITPARVLAECEAKRLIVEHEDARGEKRIVTFGGEPVRAVGTSPVLKHLALPYADHPEFDPVWCV